MLAIEATGTRDEVRDAPQAGASAPDTDGDRADAILDMAPIGVYRLGVDGSIRWANRRMCSMLGYDEGLLAGRNLCDLKHPDERADVTDRLGVLGRGSSVEERYIRRDGTVLWTRTSAAPLPDGTSGRNGWVAIVEDISEQVRSEGRMVIQHAVAHAIAEARSGEDAARCVVEWLATGLDCWGAELWWRPRQGAPLERLAAWTCPDSPCASCLIEAQWPPPVSVGLELQPGRCQLASGGLACCGRCAEVMSPLSLGGAIVGLLRIFGPPARSLQEEVSPVVRTVASLVTQFLDRLRAENETEEMARHLRLLMDSTDEGIFGLDPLGRCTFANRAAGRLLGVEAAELVGRDVHQLVHGSCASREAHDPNVCPLRCATPGLPESVRRDELCRADGGRFEAEYKVRPLLSGGNAVGTVVTFSDITARRQLETQLQRAQKMEAMGRLAGGIAHDFNNILAVITSYTSILLSEAEAGTSLREDLEAVGQAAERAGRLTRQLMTLGRRPFVETGVIDLNATVQGFERMLRRVVGEDVRLTLELGHAAGVVRLDAGRLEQVLMNLALNARDAMPHGGGLTIETSSIFLDARQAALLQVAPGRLARLRVADTGVGMDEETRARVFEPFFTTKGVGNGTGLGLAMVYGIVSQAGGHVGVESRLGAGARFEIWLPSAASAAGDPAESAAPAAPAQPSSGRVLLVEDDPDLRAVVARVLRRRGYSVRVASGAGEALQACEQESEQFDLLLTDVVMPLMRGPELASRVAQTRPGIRVLFMSGHAGDAVSDLPAAGGDRLFLPKPFQAEELLAAVDRLLAREPAR